MPRRGLMRARTDAHLTTPCTVTAYDGSTPRQYLAAFNNTQALRNMRAAVDFVAVLFSESAVLNPGDLIQVPPAQAELDAATVNGTAPPPDRWYLIEKIELANGYTVSTRATVVALPYLLQAWRLAEVDAPPPAPGDPPRRNPYGQIVGGLGTPAQPNPDAPRTTYSLRCGLTRETAPMTAQPEGQLPQGIEMLVCPITPQVRQGDHVTLPDGTLAVIQDVQRRTAENALYGYTLVLNAVD